MENIEQHLDMKPSSPVSLFRAICPSLSVLISLFQPSLFNPAHPSPSFNLFFMSRSIQFTIAISQYGYGSLHRIWRQNAVYIQTNC